MTFRVALLASLLACLLCFPSTASQHDDVVGRLITNPGVIVSEPDNNGLPGVTCGGFHWIERFTSQQLDPTDTLTLEMAIIPFPLHGTAVSLVAVAGSSALAQFEFRDGLVNGLPYNRFGWNDVAVHLRPATQDYTMTVNGATAGPFAFDSSCQRLGGCFSVEGFALAGSSLEDGAVAWVDSISLVRESAAGANVVVFQQDFQTCAPPRPFLGGLLITPPPQNLRSRR